MAFRVLAGFLAFLGGVVFFGAFYEGVFGMAVLGLLFGGTFLIYAIGGNKLINRISPFIKEKNTRWLS
jgi:hypothetical protein